MSFGMWPSSILRTWPQPSQSVLSKQGVHIGVYWEDQHETRNRRWYCPARIFPGYGGCFSGGMCWAFSPSRNICSPYIAAIQQCADNTGIVDLCLHRQVGACPHSNRETCDSWSCLHNPLVDLCVQWEVVSDGGAEVGELPDSIELRVPSRRW